MTAHSGTHRGQPRHPWTDRLVWFVRHPATNLAVGLVMIASGVADAVDDLRGGVGFEFAVHHGVIIYGLFKVLAALADIVEGLERSFRRYEARE